MRGSVTVPAQLVALLLLLSPAHAECSPSTLQGQYIFVGRGFIEPLAPNVPRVHSGIYLFDGAGKVSGKETSSRGGRVSEDQALHGTYSLKADCTGTMTFASLFDPKLETHWDIFVTADGRRANMIRTDAGSMAIRDLEK